MTQTYTTSPRPSTPHNRKVLEEIRTIIPTRLRNDGWWLEIPHTAMSEKMFARCDRSGGGNPP